MLICYSSLEARRDRPSDLPAPRANPIKGSIVAACPSPEQMARAAPVACSLPRSPPPVEDGHAVPPGVGRHDVVVAVAVEVRDDHRVRAGRGADPPEDPSRKRVETGRPRLGEAEREGWASLP